MTTSARHHSHIPFSTSSRVSDNTEPTPWPSSSSSIAASQPSAAWIGRGYEFSQKSFQAFEAEGSMRDAFIGGNYACNCKVRS
jgi:hypothetical protein